MRKDELPSKSNIWILAAIQFLLTISFLFFPLLHSPFSRTITVAFSLFGLSGLQESHILQDLLFIVFRLPLLLFGAGYLRSRFSSSEAMILTRHISMRQYFFKNLCRISMISLCNFAAIVIALGIFLLPDLCNGFGPQDMLWLRQMVPLIILYPLSGFVMLLYINLVTLVTPRKLNSLIGLGALLCNVVLFKIPSTFFQSWIPYSPLAAQSFNFIGTQTHADFASASVDVQIDLHGNALILFVSLLFQAFLLSTIISKVLRNVDYV